MLFLINKIKVFKKNLFDFFNHLNIVHRKIARINLSDDINRVNHCDVLFFCHDDDRSISLNGKAYSPLIDSVREDFEHHD